MTESSEALSTRLAQLKQTFDGTFATALQARAEQSEDLLAIELAGQPFALRARELRGLYVERAVTPLPAAPPELLGLAAVRGELVAVYDLAVLLGYARAGTPRFLVLGKSHALAFAFAKLEGHLRVARSSISPTDGAREPWFAELMREPERARPILELATLAAALEQRLRSAAPKEDEG